MIVALFIFRNLTNVSKCKVFLISPLVCLCDCRANSARQNSSHPTSCPLLIIHWGFSDWDSDVDTIKADPLKCACRYWTISSGRVRAVTGEKWQRYRRFSHLIFFNLCTIKQMHFYWVLSVLNCIFRVSQRLTRAVTLFLDLLSLKLISISILIWRKSQVLSRELKF